VYPCPRNLQRRKRSALILVKTDKDNLPTRNIFSAPSEYIRTEGRLCYERSETVDEGDDDNLPVPDEPRLKSLHHPDRPAMFLPLTPARLIGSNDLRPQGLLMGE
jgi:hypothetical protein